jgi:hypothetical protein
MACRSPTRNLARSAIPSSSDRRRATAELEDLRTSAEAHRLHVGLAVGDERRVRAAEFEPLDQALQGRLVRPETDPIFQGLGFAAIRLGTNVQVAGAAVGPGSFTNAGSGFKLRDQVVVSVTFMGVQSPAVAGLKAIESQLLLDHEQAHYDLRALNARDEFIEIMALKSRTFTTADDGVRALRAIMTRFDSLANRIDTAFDGVSETGHNAWERPAFGPPKKPLAQSRWENFIQMARTQERDPPDAAPDGTAYKIPLADLLASKGISF